MSAHDDLAIEARGLYHIYRGPELETVALRGADLALPRASWASIMGPSGSGKSTLLHVMAGLLEPSGGSVMLDGRDLTRLPRAERAALRRSLIGLVLQPTTFTRCSTPRATWPCPCASAAARSRR